MNPMTGEIVEIFIKEGSTTAKVRVDGSMMNVPLLLLMNARVGDHILIDSGIALSLVKYRSKSPQTEEKIYSHT